MRPLRGAWGKRCAGEAHVLALVLRHVAGPGGLDGPKIVVAQPPALPEGQAKVQELGFVPAHADAEDEAPTGGLVDGGGRFRRHQCAAIGKHDDAGAEAYAPRAAGEEGEQRERVGPVAAVVLGRGGLGKDVVGDEDAVEAELLRPHGERFGLGHRQLPDREHDTVVHEPPYLR